MANRDIVVIGGSAGGLEALREIVRSLPQGLPASLFVVLHTPPTSPGLLAEILDRIATLPVSQAIDGQNFEPGRIYVAQPDHHLLLKREHTVVVRGPREHSLRPAVDPLFRTAARAHGPRVIGVVLSGALDDGSFGLNMIKRFGGIAIVQNPEEALAPSMPLTAMRQVEVDHVLSASEIARALDRLCRQPLPKGLVDMIPQRDPSPDEAEFGAPGLEKPPSDKAPSGLTCPDCGGSLWEVQDGKLVRYECHVGHGYTPDTLAAAQNGAVETALWTAVRALEESASMRRRMARRAWDGNLEVMANKYEQAANDAEARAEVIRKVLATDHTAAQEEQGEIVVPRRQAQVSQPVRVRSK